MGRSNEGFKDDTKEWIGVAMERLSKSANELAEILVNKKENLSEMLKLTILQTEVIEKKEDEKLNRLIDEKQKIIDNINLLDEAFVSKLSSIKMELGIESLEELEGEKANLFKKVKLELGEVYSLTGEIAKKEKENGIKIRKEFDDIKSKIREIGKGKKVISAYGEKQIQNGGSFFDKKK